MEHESWTKDQGPWIMNCGPRTKHRGSWTRFCQIIADKTSKQTTLPTTTRSASDLDRIDLDNGRGLDPASVWLMYSKINLNSFVVQPTTRRPTVITRRPFRRLSTTLLPTITQDTPITDVTTNRTACRVDNVEVSRPEVAVKHVEVIHRSNSSSGESTTSNLTRNISKPVTSDENKTMVTPSGDNSPKQTIIGAGSTVMTSLIASPSSRSIVGVDDIDDESDEEELDEDAPTEQKLMYRLMRHYEKSVRPVRNASEMVLVKMGLTLTQIFNMDEKNQILVTNVWLDQEWDDMFLQWDPAEYGGLEVLRLPCHKLWLPDIVLYNNAAEYTDGLMPANAMITHLGNIFWPIPAKLLSTCKVDVTYFPFDEQYCLLKFGSWTYDGFQVDMTNRTTDIDLSNYVENGEWELLSITIQRNVVYYACCKEPFPDVTFTLHIRRRTLYYLYNVIFPCVMMSALTLLVFCLPPDSGEKVTMGITVLLSFSVFLLRMGEDLPETSEFIPLLSVYLTIVMAMTSVSVILTVFVLNLHYRGPDDRPVPRWLRRLLGHRTLRRGLTIRARHSGAPNHRLKINDLPRHSSRYRDRSTTQFACAMPEGARQRSRSVGDCSSSQSTADLHESHTCQHDLQFSDIDCREMSLHMTVETLANELSDELQQLRCHGHGLYSDSEYREINDDLLVDSRSPSPGVATCRHATNDDLCGESSAVVDGGYSKIADASSHQILSALHRVVNRYERDDAIAMATHEWRRLAVVVDKILFWIFLVGTLTSTLVILVLIPFIRWI